MATHKVYLGRQTGRAMATPCSLEPDGPEILRSVQPIYDCARYLLDNHLAQAGDLIEMCRGSIMSMSGRIGRCAEFSVSETNRGLRLVTFRPFPGPATAPAEKDLRSLAAKSSRSLTAAACRALLRHQACPPVAHGQMGGLHQVRGSIQRAIDPGGPPIRVERVPFS